MLRKLWNAYSDFINCEWLVRGLGNDPVRAIGFLAIVFAFYVLYTGTLSVHKGQVIAGYAKNTGLYTFKVTEESRVEAALFSTGVGLLGGICLLPHEKRVRLRSWLGSKRVHREPRFVPSRSARVITQTKVKKSL